MDSEKIVETLKEEPALADKKIEQIQPLPADLLRALREMEAEKTRVGREQSLMLSGYFMGVGLNSTPPWTVDLDTGIARRAIGGTEPKGE